MQAGDLPVHGGRTLAYVYDSGLPDVDRIGREAVAAYAGSNGLDPTAFPSLLRMENDLVGFTADLLDAPPEAVGTVTSGGTESVLLAVQGARDSRPDVDRPRMVLPTTIHAAFLKAAHYFGVEAVLVPVGPDFRADVAATRAAIDEAPERTVLVAVSAPSYAHGVIDPVTEIAAYAAERGIRCHVDACIGGWVLPYAARLGRDVRPWTFAVDGVTSISVDLHKYGYAPKGTSVLLHRTAAQRRPQYFAYADWPGYTMLNSTLQSTKSGGPLAGAWAVVESLGDAGYERAHRRRLRRGRPDRGRHRHDPRADGGRRPGLHPDRAGDRRQLRRLHGVRRDGDAVVVRPAADDVRRPAADHPPLGECSDPARTSRSSSAALTESVAAAVAAGPVAVDPDVAAFIGALDPSALSDADFDGLLAASGLVGEADAAGGDLALPDPDGRGQRDDRRGQPRRCARRCWSRSWTGCAPDRANRGTRR